MIAWRKLGPGFERSRCGRYHITWRQGGFSIWIVQAWCGELMLAEHVDGHDRCDYAKRKARTTCEEHAEVQLARGVA